MLRIAAARLPSEAVFSWRSAAWLHGVPLDPLNPIGITVPDRLALSSRTGVVVGRPQLVADDIARVQGLRATSAMRTLVDLGLAGTLTEALIDVDIALHSGLVALPDLLAHVEAQAGAYGIKRLRRIAELAEPATESPMETRLRLILISGGLPRPQAQVELRDDRGQRLGRVDFFYPAKRLVIEYDGSGHRDRLEEDNRRQNAILRAGFQLQRYTYADLQRPDLIVHQVRAAPAA